MGHPEVTGELQGTYRGVTGESGCIDDVYTSYHGWVAVGYTARSMREVYHLHGPVYERIPNETRLNILPQRHKGFLYCGTFINESYSFLAGWSVGDTNHDIKRLKAHS
jgi:hypothetical protein